MKKINLFNKSSFFILSILVALFAALASLFPSLAFAEGRNVVAFTYENGVRTYYTSTQEALDVGYSGKKIYLARDWVLGSTLEIPESKSLSIDMNGKSIRGNGNKVVIYVNDNASLTLSSLLKNTFAFDGYENSTGDKKTLTMRAGGLVTGGYSNSDEGAGGIFMGNNSTLTLDGVAVAGNKSYGAGGIYAKSNCNIFMKNDARVEGNFGLYGGILAQGDDVSIHMDASKVTRNYAFGDGGGIRSSGDATRIYMEDSSEISENYAQSGAGIYFEYSYFGVYSQDKTAKIRANSISSDDESGGGIYAEVCKWKINEGEIRGVNLCDNVATKNGGGLFLQQRYTRVNDCVISGNKARSGGGVYVDNDDITFSNCTIQDNICESSREGGGIFVHCENDIWLIGKTIITGNTRGENGSADDVFLQETVGDISRAYVKGGVDAGSKVGIRTGIVGDRRIGINISTYTYGTYFIDIDGYYVSHGTDEGGDLWQRKAEDVKFSLKVNGSEIARFKYSEFVCANGSATDESKIFWYWDAGSAVGLNPVSDYINETNSGSAYLAFNMPQNDVSINAVYANLIEKGRFYVDAPVAGQNLPTECSFIRTDSGSGPSDKITGLSVVWYEIDANGNKVQASGVAKYNAKYVANFFVRKRHIPGVGFSQNITASDVDVFIGSESHNSASASVSQETGGLTVESWEYTTEKAGITSIESASVDVSVGTSARELEKLLPNNAIVKLADGTTSTLSTDKSGQINWPEGLLDLDNFVKNPEGGSATFTMTLPLYSSKEIPGSENKNVEITLNVKLDQTILTPELSPLPQDVSFNKYSGTYRLSDDLKLKVLASGATEDAEILYRIDDGEARTYYESDGIILVGVENKVIKRTIECWSQKYVGGVLVKSDSVFGTYSLDDTLRKTINVNCKDTSLAGGDDKLPSSFEVMGNLGQSVCVVAPKQESRIFSHWEWEGAPAGVDLTQENLTIDDFSLDLNERITAVYIPTITTIDIGIEAPVAHNSLAKNASYVKVGTCGAGATTDIVNYFADGAAISWSPNVESDGSATHATTYTASLNWNVDLPKGVEYAASENLDLLVNGKAFEGSVNFIVDVQGNLSLQVAFPQTGSRVFQSLSEIEDVNLTFEEAYAFQINQEAKKTSNWDLPSEVEMKFACGESELVDIEWDTPSTFDKDKLEAQTINVTGKVKCPYDVDASSLPQTINTTINVSSPDAVEAPSASVLSGTFTEAQKVKLDCVTDGATIRYTIDGTQVDETSPIYSGEIEVSTTTTIRAKAFREAMIPSDESTFTYTIQQPVSVNGTVVNYYTAGENVSVSGQPTSSTKAFLRWSEVESAGLTPFSDYIKNVDAQNVEFTMPNNPVNLVAEYLDRVSDVKLEVSKPVAGQTLPTAATLSWDGGSKIVSIQWVEDNGNVVETAPFASKLSLKCAIAQDLSSKLAFIKTMTADNVKVNFAGETTTLTTQSASVDSLGNLNFKAGTYETEKPEIINVADAKIEVVAGTTAEKLKSSMPKTAIVSLSDSSTCVINTDLEQDILWPAGLLDGRGNVADPTGETYVVNLALAESDAVVSVDGKTLKVEIEVLPNTQVATPVVSPINATYNKYTGDIKLTQDLKLKVSAICSTEAATIKYKVDGGIEEIYNDEVCIEIQGVENDQAYVEVEVWAEKLVSGIIVKSDSELAGFLLDDTLNKTIQVSCVDTALYDEGQTHWSTSFDVTSDLKSPTTITAPEQKNRTFDHWEWESAPEGTDLTQQTLKINEFSLDLSGQIKAVYVPTITTLDIGVKAPVAHNSLAGKANYVRIGTASDTQSSKLEEDLFDTNVSTDITSYFANDAQLNWTPSADASGCATHLATYTAKMLMDGQFPEEVHYNISENVQLLVNGRDAVGDVHIEIDPDEVNLVITFPNTSPYKFASFEGVSDSSISFNAACVYEEAQSAGDTVNWGLPTQVEVNFECGEVGMAEIEWEGAFGFDPAKLQAQTLTATGKLKFPDNVDTSGAPENVVVKVNVDAPAPVATPIASPKPGVYAEAQMVELECETVGATIKFTTNGEEPTQVSDEYTDAIEVSFNTTIKARAFVSGMEPSEVATFEYVIGENAQDESAEGLQAATPQALSPNTGDVYVKFIFGVVALCFASISLAWITSVLRRWR